MTSTKLRGVARLGHRRYRAQICRAGFVHQVGMFLDREAAGRAWDMVHWAYNRDPDRLNFPDNVPAYDAAVPAVKDEWNARMSLRRTRSEAMDPSRGGASEHVAHAVTEGREKEEAGPETWHGERFEMLLRVALAGACDRPT